MIVSLVSSNFSNSTKKVHNKNEIKHPKIISLKGLKKPKKD